MKWLEKLINGRMWRAVDDVSGVVGGAGVYGPSTAMVVM